MLVEWISTSLRWVTYLYFSLVNWMTGINPILLLITGILFGLAIALISAAIQQAHIRRQVQRTWEKTPFLRWFAPRSLIESVTRQRRRNEAKTGKFMRQETVEDRESKLSEMLLEMLDMILQLTDVITSTNSISGDAAEKFSQTRQALENLTVDDADAGLNQLRAILLTEIDHMVQTNITLKKELEKAENGMSKQKQEIDKLTTKANIDQLTQLLNRAAFDNCLNKAFEHWKQTKEVFSLLMLDIDHFKSINDTHGHVNGDRLLKEIALKIKDGIRGQDHAARYGGEEFAVILPDTQAEEALMVGTRIRESVERGHFQVDTRPLRITISGGIAQTGVSGTPTNVVEIADKALYLSKKRGRNRITLGEDILKEAWTSNEGREPAMKAEK